MQNFVLDGIIHSFGSPGRMQIGGLEHAVIDIPGILGIFQ